MKNARYEAVSLLGRMDREQAYSNLLLDHFLQTCGMDAREKAFLSTLFYGVLERRLTLDYVIRCYSSIPMYKLSTQVKNILRTALYQLLYLDVPENAAVDEAVKLTRVLRQSRASGYVNALLRSFLRAGKDMKLPDESDPVRNLSVCYSCGEPLVRTFLCDYGFETAKNILSAALEKPPVTVRVNTLRTERDSLQKRLAEEGVPSAVCDAVEDALIWKGSGSVEHLATFREGLFHVQDASSQLCALAAGPQAGDTVYDICSAPGGKAFTMAQYMKDRGTLAAFDLYESRTRLIDQGAQRLGLTCLTAQVRDALQGKPLPPADVVLCDVPCTGSGILRRKPEIKYKPLDTVLSLAQTQYDILLRSSAYVKAGGRLLYSTCSIDKRENEDVVQHFLQENPAFELDELPRQFAKFQHAGEGCVTILPGEQDCDGFFIAILKKRN